MIRTSCLFALLVVAAACGGSPPVRDAAAGATQPGPANGQRPAAERVPADSTTALDEFEPLTRADVDLYLKVMRTAAERLKNLPASDRQALHARDAFPAKAGAGQMPSADEFAAMERGTELLACDGIVAREMGVEKRYRSIRNRVPQYGMPEMAGEGDEPLSAEERARVMERVRRFRERRKADDALFAPYKDEIQGLQKQVDLITHPESIPR